MPETSYAPCGELSLAYQIFGAGPVELVFIGPMVSHIELFWTMPEFKSFFDQLAAFCRVVLFDKAGVGLSDPVPRVRTLDDRVTEIEAVMDAAGFSRAALFGMSEGGAQAVYFAAKRPQRTRALIVYGSFAYLSGGGWDEVLGDPEALSAHLVGELGAKYTPSLEQIRRIQAFARAARSQWGSGASALALTPSVRSLRQLAMFERMASSPGMARATMESNFHIDLRPVLPGLRVPTLVTHARGDGVPVQCGRYLADHIPGAKYLELEGVDHAPWLTEPDTILTGIEELLTGGHAVGAPAHRVLRTVVFTDIVASTQHAAAAGDERWRAIIERFGEINAELVARFGAPSSRAPATVTSQHSTARPRPSTVPRPCTRTPNCWASRSGSASTPVSANCWMATSPVSPCTSPPGSWVRPAPARSSSPAPCVTWSWVRAPASPIAAASSCVVCPAVGNCSRSTGTVPGRIRRRRSWRRRRHPARGPPCTAPTAPSRCWRGERRGCCAGWRG